MQNSTAVFRLNISNKTSFCASILRPNAKPQTELYVQAYPNTRIKLTEYMNFDINFDFHTDANGGDPDLTSPTLKKYHKILWSKILSDGRYLMLDKKSGAYLHHYSEIGEFYLGSDAITNSYKHHKSKKWLTEQIAEEVQELFNAGSTIGAYIVYPNKKNGGHTINQARGVNRFIDDRFDLTLECIRLFYENKNSPLFDTFIRYKNFFDIFVNFKNYVDFFLLQDLVDENYNVIFFLPFDNFQTQPKISTKEEYLQYKNNAINFIYARNKRIENYVNENIEELKRLHIITKFSSCPKDTR